MHVDLVIDQNIFPELYNRFALFVYKKMKSDIYSLSHKKMQNYEIRKELLMQSTTIDKKTLQSLNLIDCINEAIELVFVSGVYVIKLNPIKRVKGTNLKLYQLVRLLEYGTLTFPELPVLRRVFRKYRNGYNELFNDFIEEEFR